MKHIALVLAVAFGLLAIGIACDDGDDAPVATNTPGREATATPAVGSTAPPIATTTAPGPTATPRPDVEGRCPINDESFCNLAIAFDEAIRSRDV